MYSRSCSGYGSLGVCHTPCIGVFLIRLAKSGEVSTTLTGCQEPFDYRLGLAESWSLATVQPVSFIHRRFDMTDLEKLELVHCAIQEVIKLDLPSGLDEEMDNALAIVEELREPYLIM